MTPLDADPARALVLEDGPVTLDPVLVAAGAAHRDRLLAASPGTFDGPVLCLWRVEGGTLHVRRAGYFGMLATCDALRADPSLRPVAVAAAGGDPQSSGAGRAAAVGVSVACTVPVGGVPHLVLGRRQPRLAADPGRWHVAPSGMLEEGDPDPLVATVATELREELGVELPVAEVGRRLRILGIAHDLDRLRPDICVRLDLDEADVPAGGPHLHASEYDARELVPLTTAGLATLWDRRPPGSLTAPAAGTLALLETARVPPG